jgi:chitosanase
LKIILGGSGISVPDRSGNGGFTDTQSDAWYSKYILRALELGIIKGYADGTFKPGQTVSLVESLKIILLANQIDLSGIQVSQKLYADVYPNQWYLPYLQYAKDHSLIVADAANRIYPGRAVNRGTMAEIIYRLIKSNGGLMPTQKQRAEELTSLFENGTKEIQYGITENLDDGRGITAGRAGFTTANGDALEVVKRYTAAEPGNPLAKYLPELEKLYADGSDDTSNLQGYAAAWAQAAASDPLFRKTQDQVADDWYYFPAMKIAANNGLKLPLSLAAVYDAMIQHGGGDDPDGLPAIIDRTNKKAGGNPGSGVDEKIWLSTFLQIRRDDLLNPADTATGDAWAQSVSRVDVFQYLAAQGNYYLSGPVTIKTDIYNETLN